MRPSTVLLVAACLLATLVSYDRAQSTAPAGGSVTPAKVDGGVRSITTPELPPPELADGPHKEVFLGVCMTCHTARYVTMQPAFSKKTWTAEVEKMKKVYGAPLTDEQMPQVVDYLLSIRGK